MAATAKPVAPEATVSPLLAVLLSRQSKSSSDFTDLIVDFATSAVNGTTEVVAKSTTGITDVWTASRLAGRVDSMKASESILARCAHKHGLSEADMAAVLASVS